MFSNYWILLPVLFETKDSISSSHCSCSQSRDYYHCYHNSNDTGCSTPHHIGTRNLSRICSHISSSFSHVRNWICEIIAPCM